MPLVSKLFTQPFDAKLAACLVNDAAHITPGSRGEHVRKIQIALNRLNEGPGRANTFLIMDGIYGPNTATAVQEYKDERDITQPWQDEADNIVGKQTIQSLDDEMDILENTVDSASNYVSLHWTGQPHDHTRCPPYRGGSEAAPGPTISHSMTPINPIGTGKMISIGGQGEVEYLDFIDYVPDPTCDPSFPPAYIQGRLLTSSIASGTVSDICFRSAPFDAWMRTEVRRICMHGARLTFAGDVYKADKGEMADIVEYLKTIGDIIEYGDATDTAMFLERQYVVARITDVDHKLLRCNSSTKARPADVEQARRGMLRSFGRHL